MPGSYAQLCPIHYDFKSTLSRIAPNLKYLIYEELIRLHRFKDIVPRRLPQLQRPEASNEAPSYPLLPNLFTKSELQMPHTMFNNLLQLLTDLRETFYLCAPIYYRGYYKG